MNKFVILLFLTILFLTILFALLYINFKYNNQGYRENFISKLKLDKNLIVVMMDGTIGNEYTSTIKSLCENYIDNCIYNFDEDKVSNLEKVNITYDKSLNTSSKIKNVNYLVIYQKKYYCIFVESFV